MCRQTKSDFVIDGGPNGMRMELAIVKGRSLLGGLQKLIFTMQRTRGGNVECMGHSREGGIRR